MERKFTDDQVREARKAFKRYDSVNGCNALARKYGVAKSVMYKLLTRETYTHVA